VLCANAHLSDDEAVAKMGHPGFIQPHIAEAGTALHTTLRTPPAPLEQAWAGARANTGVSPLRMTRSRHAAVEMTGCWLAEADEVDGHGDTEECEDDCEGDGGAGGLAGLPGAGGEFLDGADVTEHRSDVDEDAEGYQHDADDDGVGGFGFGGGVLGGGEFAEEEAKAADREANAHEAEAGADPGEEGAFGGEVDAGVLLGGVGHG
jgi:hypothetical protein